MTNRSRKSKLRARKRNSETRLHSGTKLTLKQATLVWKWYGLGLPVKYIANYYGCSTGLVCKIATGKVKQWAEAIPGFRPHPVRGPKGPNAWTPFPISTGNPNRKMPTSVAKWALSKLLAGWTRGEVVRVLSRRWNVVVSEQAMTRLKSGQSYRELRVGLEVSR